MDKKVRVEIKVNGKPIALNAFAESIVGNTIEAMILSLRLEEKPDRVEISISK